MAQVGPQLVEHDLQDIIDSDPVTLPLTRTGLSRLDLHGFCKVDISASSQNRYQSISLKLISVHLFMLKSPHFSSSNRHSRDFSSPCDEDRQSRLMANQACDLNYFSQNSCKLCFSRKLNRRSMLLLPKCTATIHRFKSRPIFSAKR